MGRTIFRRYYNGKEFHADSEVDAFNTLREANRKAKYYRRSGYNARIARRDCGKRRYAVYHSIEYTRR